MLYALVASAAVAAAAAGSDGLPTLEVPTCPHVATASGFSLIGFGSLTAPPQETSASVCWNQTHLRVKWAAASKDVVSNSTKCHDKVWTQDAVEFYISPGSQTSTNYTEIDSSPRGGLWLGRIVNPSGYDPSAASYKNLPDCTASGVRLRTALDKAGFTASLDLPFSFLLGTTSYADVPTEWRANFYRWNTVPRNLTAWSPTSCDGVWPCNAPHVSKRSFARLDPQNIRCAQLGLPQQLHQVPKYFGHLRLIKDRKSTDSAPWGGALAAFRSAFDLRRAASGA